MALSGFLDSCVLFSITLTDTLLNIADEEVFEPFWSPDVLDELKQAVITSRMTTEEKITKRITAMKNAFANASVNEYRDRIDEMTCHPKDRHVLAAAVAARCDVLVTFNVSDFPEASVQPHKITVMTPDEFLLDRLHTYPDRIMHALTMQLLAMNNPPRALNELLNQLEKAGVPAFADEIHRHEFR